MFEKRESVHFRHEDVKEHQIDAPGKRFDLFERLQAVGRLRNAAEPRQAGEVGFVHARHHRIVFNNHHADHFFLLIRVPQPASQS